MQQPPQKSDKINSIESDSRERKTKREEEDAKKKKKPDFSLSTNRKKKQNGKAFRKEQRPEKKKMHSYFCFAILFPQPPSLIPCFLSALSPLTHGTEKGEKKMKDSVKKLGKEKAKVNDRKSAPYDKEETRQQNTKRTVLSTCDCSTSKNYRKKGGKTHAPSDKNRVGELAVRCPA